MKEVQKKVPALFEAGDSEVEVQNGKSWHYARPQTVL